MRKLLLASAGVGLAASLTLAGSVPALAAQPRAAGWFTVSGAVTGADGPVHVWLYAWPSAAVVRSLRPGQQVPLTVLGEQTTSTGRYALRLSPVAVPGRIVNMEVAAFGGGAMTARSFTRWRVAGPAGTVLAMPFGPAQMAVQIANMRLHPAVANGPCFFGGTLSFKRNLGLRWVVVGGTYSRVNNITARFSYYDGQSSSLGVALSAGGTYKGFSESGTLSISQQSQSLGSSTFPTFHGVGSQNHSTEFRFGQYRWFCNGPHGSGGWANWQVQANDSAGGATSPRASSAFRTPYCVFYQGASTFSLSTTTAYTFSRGVSIHDLIGIDLSSETGYDATAALSYAVTGKNGRLICGKNNNPLGRHPAPQLVVAGQQAG